MSKQNKEKSLEVKIEDDVLTISIGVETLAFALQNSDEWLRENLKITNAHGFAIDILNQLETEQEDGTTPVHLLFEDAANEAAEYGSEWIEEVESEE